MTTSQIVCADDNNIILSRAGEHQLMYMFKKHFLAFKYIWEEFAVPTKWGREYTIFNRDLGSKSRGYSNNSLGLPLGAKYKSKAMGEIREI